MNIVWSPLAQIDYWLNIEFLETHWTEKEVFTFIDQTDHTINLIASDNASFVKTGYKNVYKVPIVSQVSLFYTCDGNTLTLLRFWNNYQNPEELKLR